MSLTAAEIAVVLAELREILVGARVRRVHQLDPSTLLLRTPGPGLCLSCHPRASRIHLVTEEPPRQPVGDFAQLARRALEGGRFLGFEQPGEDRLVRVTIGRGGAEVSLVAELTGRHGNLFLVAGDQILGSILPNRSRRRRLLPGEPYVPMAPHPDARPPLDRDFAAHPAGPSAAVETWYDAALAAHGLADRRRRLAAPLKGRHRAQRRLAKALAGDLERHRAARAGQRWGDLLLAQPHAVPKGAAEALVTDLFADDEAAPPVRIPLDPRLTPAQNAQRHYVQARRGRRGEAEAQGRLDRTRAEITALETALAQLEAADEATLTRLEAEVHRARTPADPPSGPRAKGRPRGPKGQAGPRAPYRSFTAARGEAILVGRSAADNGALTFTVARGRDVFLHARDVPGSHVILRLPRGGEPDHESLRDAALLAKRYSGAREEPAADVTWTFVKHVRRGKVPGQVYLAGERTLRVAEDPARWARLRARQDEPGALQRALGRAAEGEGTDAPGPEGAGDDDAPGGQPV